MTEQLSDRLHSHAKELYRVGQFGMAADVRDAAMLVARMDVMAAELRTAQSTNVREGLVEVPVEFVEMAKVVAADKFEHCTRDPVFCVEKRRKIAGMETDWCDDIIWIQDGEECSERQSAGLEREYDKTCEVPYGFTRTGYVEIWEHVTSYFTQAAAEAFIKGKGDDYRLNIDSAYRNHEWKIARKAMLDAAEAEDGAS